MQVSCPRCAAQSSSEARFCPACGWDLARPYRELNLSPLRVALLALSSLALLGGVWTMQSKLLGKRPILQAGLGVPDPYRDPELENARKNAEAHPKDAQILKVYAGKLWTVLGASETPDRQMVLDLVDVLGAVLEMKPEDAEALFMMANLAFNEKVFDKAAGYYERYLKLSPKDFAARASYASSLTFLSKYSDALRELDLVKKDAPDYFQAEAYRAITYAQMGKLDEAKKSGERALDLSPNDDARTRLNAFLQGLGTKESSTTFPKTGPGSRVIDFIRNHEIAGPKFVTARPGGNATLDIHLRGFPMDKMPPFARDAFTAKVKVLLPDDGVTEVVIRDADTGAEMARIKASSR